MLQQNPNLILEDHFVDLINTIRCIMRNIASMTTQARLYNLYSGISFAGKPEQVEKSEVKPLISSEKFDTQLVAIKPTKRARFRRTFHGSQQIEGRPSPVSSIHPTAAIDEAAAKRPVLNSSGGGFQKVSMMSLGKAHGKSVDPENRGEGVPNIFQKIEAEQQGLRREQKKSFCRARSLEWPASTKKRDRLGEESSEFPKIDFDRTALTDHASSAIQAVSLPRGPPDSDGRGGVDTNKNGN
ncbi:hypothetical protein AYI69_g334 [Smittium culicis]|uniref:Uncharacterized protein n=1 Tax=Smittium culicis TaxID=133412 RepID=A0A1R1YTC8_9FUNG|nr:hypothetical protein AYI69_g334 [Smittium culicis]